MAKVGDRIGAVMSMDSRTVKFFGYGTYEGQADVGLPILTPKLKMDDGSIVYGCECWWGPEEQIKNEIELALSQGAKLEKLAISDLREPIIENETVN